jgi:WD40 repeat protein
MYRLTLLSFLLCCTASHAAAQGTPVSFYKQVKPILQKRCQGCHQPASQGGKLILTSYAAFKAGGATGPSFVPGRPEDSVLMRFITGNPPSMPKNAKPLSGAEVGLIRKWIAEGAKNDTPVIKDPIDQDHPPVYTNPPVISALAYSPDGRTLAVSGFREVLLHKSDGTGLVARLVGRSHRINSLVYSTDGKVLAAVGGNPAQFGEVQFWNTETNKLINSIELGYDEFYGASFSPDGKELAFGSADNSVRIVSVPDGKLQMKFDNHSDWTFATAWTMPEVEKIKAEVAKIAGGTTNRPLVPEAAMHLLSTGRDRAVKLIVAKTGSFVDDINTFTSPYRTLAGHPTQNWVLVGGDDGIPRLYQIFRTKPRTMNQEDQSLLRTFEKQPGQINTVAFTRDGSRFAVAGEGGEVRIYNTDDGKLVAAGKGLPGVTFSVSFRPDGQELAVGGLDGQVRLFHAMTGALVKAFVPVAVGKAAAKAL